MMVGREAPEPRSSARIPRDTHWVTHQSSSGASNGSLRSTSSSVTASIVGRVDAGIDPQQAHGVVEAGDMLGEQIRASGERTGGVEAAIAKREAAIAERHPSIGVGQEAAVHPGNSGHHVQSTAENRVNE